MKRLKSLKWAFLLAFAFSILGGACGVYADSGYDYYDSLFIDDKFVLYTDIRENFDDFGDLSSFMNYVRTFLSASRQLYYNSEDDWATENVDVEDCDYESKKCQFAVWRHDQNGQSVVQRYRDISIVIDSNIDSLFPMMDGYDLPINYDENMFSSDEEKNNYVSRYLSEYNRESVNYSIDTTIYEERNLWKQETLKEGVNIIARKRLDNISFNYIEESYSDIFKLFSSGALTIRTARSGLVVDNEYLDNYLWLPNNEHLGDYNNNHSDNYWFSRDSNVKDGKVIIRLTRRDENGYLISDEKHLLAIDIVYLPDLYFGEPLDYYDDLFDNGTLYLRTDVRDDLSELSNDDAFTDYVRAFGGFNRHEVYYNSSEDYLGFNLNIDRCVSNSRQCWFSVDRSSYSDGKYTDEYVKYYDGINVVIEPDISGLFPMMSGDDLIVNYEEDLLSTDEEKREYASNYLGSFSGSSVSYYFSNYLENAEYIYRVERIKDGVERIARKRLGRIVFDYTEGPYSDNFKRLTEGTLTIKTDSEIDNNLLDAYLQEMNGDGSLGFFFRSGDIRDGKAFIGLQKYINNTYQTEETHLVALVKDANIDTDAFVDAGYGSDVDIPADEPSNNKVDYVLNYFNIHNNSTSNNDGSYMYFSVRPDYSNPDEVSILYLKYDNQGRRTDLQLKRARINYVGYVDTYSNEYNEAVGGEITINADSLNYNAINEALWRMSHGALSVYALGCSDDYSFCDIAAYGSEFGIEIHKVKMVLDATVSDEFKDAFNLKDDGTIDIIMDKDVVLGSWGFSYYAYNESNNLEFNCDLKGSCQLRLSNHENGVTEVHSVSYNVINSNPTSYFSSIVNNSVDVYPGENINVWDINYVSGIFSKKEYDYDTNALSCDSTKKKCSVAKYNSSKQLEIHNTAVSIKNGKSPKFESIAPGDKISLNAIYLDDDIYIDDVASAYFLSKSKAYMYLSDYDGEKAKIFYNNYEMHTMNVEFAKGNSRHKAAVDGVIKKIGSTPLKFYIDDLEFVNYFYYNDRSNALPNNYNSKSMKEQFSNIINNKHISYYLLERGGMGDRFMEEWGGEVVLYYDGIAYGKTESYFATNKRNIIYIPDDTPNTKEAFVAAAQKRVDGYLGKKSGVVISYLEKAEGDVADYFMDDNFDATGFDGNIYHIAYKNKEEDILILKNSKKMQRATFHATDVNNNIDVSSENANYPTNTVVSAETISEKTQKYKDLLKKLGLSVAQVVDISLYSPSIGDINNFNGVSFSVNVPIQTSLFGSGNLYAYFVSDDGKIEEHPIAMDDFMGMFGTNHFSTYVIAEKVDNKVIEEANNPSTYDDVKMWIVAGSLCGIGLAGALVYIKAKVLRKTR